MCKTEGTDWEATAMMHISLKLEAWKAIERVRELHKPVTSHEYKKINGILERIETLGCSECEETGSGREYLVKYPCPTIKALDGEQ